MLRVWKAVSNHFSCCASGVSTHGNVVDPDQVGAVDGDTVTAPHVLRVQVLDSNVLDDNVADAANHAKTFSSDDTLVALANDGLVRVDGDA